VKINFAKLLKKPVYLLKTCLCSAAYLCIFLWLAAAAVAAAASRCKRASLYCREGDTECLHLPSSISFNFITFVSNLAIPPMGYIDLFTMRGPLWSSSSVRFKLDVLDSRAPVGITKVAKDFFQLRHTSLNQAIISLKKSIEGPQEIDLQLSMELYHSGVFGGSALAKLSIFVSEYEF
jgi:fibulin 1/2